MKFYFLTCNEGHTFMWNCPSDFCSPSGLLGSCSLSSSSF